MNNNISNDKIIDKQKYLFVSGPPRSGTTLLELILSSHSMITITPETTFIQDFFRKKINPHKAMAKEDFEFLKDLMKNDKKLNGWPNFSLDDFFKYYDDKKNIISFHNLLKELFLYFSKCVNGGTKYIGNKKGLYAGIDAIYTKEIFPNAKFIYIFRDPRDVTRSNLKKTPEKTHYEIIQTINSRYEFVLKMLNLYPTDVLIIQYEKLLHNPKLICENICNFLNLPYENEMLNYYKTNKNGSRIISGKLNIHTNTQSPLNPNLIGQWKKDNILSKKNIKDIEFYCKKLMKDFNYKIEYLNFFDVLILKLKTIKLTLNKYIKKND